jgi:glucose/arabinose dehydrogenase/mono/diheme cytochrome c family protein
VLLLLLACRDPQPEPGPLGSDESTPEPARCQALPSPGDPSARVELTPVYEGLELSSPTAAVWVEQDGGGRWVVGERAGAIWSFGDEEPADPVLIGDISHLLGEAKHGLLGLAKHPSQPLWFLSFTQRIGQGEARSLVLRVPQRVDGRLDLEAAEELLSLPQPNESAVGGRLAFDLDGLLVLAFGEGGMDEAVLRSPETWYGKFLRLDVEDPEARPEVFASGLRNPWGWVQDPVTARFWVADPGTELWEEVNLLQPGGDHGWPIYEGPDCLRDDERCEEDFVEPVYAYPHTDGPRAIIGGPVYRGAALPEWTGAFVFADYLDQGLYALSEVDGGYEATTLLSAGPRFATLATGPGGEVYGFEFEPTGSAWRIDPVTEPAPGFPETLSETGCFGPDGEPADNLQPYELIAPFWSDGADKERFAALPEGELLGITEEGDLDFPVGAVLAKTFRVEGRLVETRLLMRHEDSTWSGAAWVWDEDGQEARLAEQATDLDLGPQTWTVPGRGDCLRCHTEAAGRSLGPELPNLDEGQERAWIELGWLSDLPVHADLTDPYGAGDLDERARSWLHSNCSGCHRPEGGLEVDLDLRFATQLTATGLCELDDGELVERITSADGERMPPLGTSLIDEDGTALVETWLREGASCP